MNSHLGRGAGAETRQAIDQFSKHDIHQGHCLVDDDCISVRMP